MRDYALIQQMACLKALNLPHFLFAPAGLWRRVQCDARPAAACCAALCRLLFPPNRLWRYCQCCCWCEPSTTLLVLLTHQTLLLCAFPLPTRLWRYCLSVLDREGPDEEALAAAEDDADDDDEDADEDLGGAADIDGWDVEGRPKP